MRTDDPKMQGKAAVPPDAYVNSTLADRAKARKAEQGKGKQVKSAEDKAVKASDSKSDSK